VILSDFIDNNMEKEVFDIVVIDSHGKILEKEIDYGADVLQVEYKKIAIIKTTQWIII